MSTQNRMVYKKSGRQKQGQGEGQRMEDHHEDGFGELVNTQDHGVVQMLPQGILVANHEGVEVGQNGQGQKVSTATTMSSAVCRPPWK